MSSRPGTASKQNKNKQQPQKRPSGQPQLPPKPKLTPEQIQAQAAQEAAQKEARMQRQAQARAEAERKQRTQKTRTYAIVGLVGLAVVALIAWLILREAGKPGESVPIMADRHHLKSADEAHVPYSTDPPTSGPHVDQVPAFNVHTEAISKELQVHGLEDGGVIVNYKPDLDKATVEKLAALVGLYNGTAGKRNVLMAPYPDLSNPIVLTSWGRIQRFDTFDEPNIRKFVDAYVNIDHHEGTEGQRLP